jgi:hypothetical protein
MALKYPGRREFTQLVSHHILGNKDLIKHFAVMDEKCKTYELGNYRTPSRPCLYRLTRTGFRLLVDFDKQRQFANA